MSAASQQSTSQKFLAAGQFPKSGQKMKRVSCWFFALAFLLIVLIGAIFVIGAEQTHEANNHLLYDSFDQSPEHVDLMKQLAKTKLAIVYGKKQEGLFQFIQHYANKLTLKGKTIYVEEVDGSLISVTKLAQNVKEKIDEALGFDQDDGDWIILSKNGQIVDLDFVRKLQDQNPKNKIIIATVTRKQRNPGFKVLEYPDMEEHEIEESIQRNFNVPEITADLLYDYFQTPEKIYQELDVEKLDVEQVLGENFKTLEGLGKEQIRILKDLCKFGEGNSKQASQKLAEIGVIFHDGENFWVSAAARLNYEIQKGLNCKNKIISEEILKEIEEKAEIQEQQRAQKQRAEAEAAQSKNRKKKSKK